MAAELAQQYGVKTIAHYADLSQPDAAEQLYAYCHENQLVVDILINNAGVFFFNPYCETSMKRIELMLQLHMITVAKMTRLFGEDMMKRELTEEEAQQRICGRKRMRGYILNMSSMSAWMAMPGIQTYNATKAFIYNFSKSIWYEFKPKNVGVTVMAPGAVDTALFGLAPHLRKLAVALAHNGILSKNPHSLIVSIRPSDKEQYISDYYAFLEANRRKLSFDRFRDTTSILSSNNFSNFFSLS